jgi:hypothetical protein
MLTCFRPDNICELIYIMTHSETETEEQIWLNFRTKDPVTLYTKCNDIYRWKEIKSENYCLFIHSNIWIILETFDFLRYYSNFLIVIWTYKWYTIRNVIKECPECKNRNACIFTVHTITVLSIRTLMNCIVFIIQNNCYNYISETHLR